MNKIALTSLFAVVGGAAFLALNSFCGIYVAKADMKLFNKSSEVILARDGDQTAITMSNDFQGDATDFAMVIPVPVVLRKDQIRVLKDASIFQKLGDYSAPRLVEYYDENPCDINKDKLDVTEHIAANAMAPNRGLATKEEQTVKIEARYTIGEYDIILLSAKESGGLKTWLINNGYKIPAQAEEVLEPYIKSDMKFFVAKVNLANFTARGFQTLRPIQITFNSPKFMLPIRLGMANSTGYQDLIVYAFSKSGIVEPVNYRLNQPPTDRNVPEFVQQKFGLFYKALFDRTWQNNPSSLFLEYAWDLDSKNYLHCDPCPCTPPTYAEMNDAGVFWVSNVGDDGSGSSDYDGDVFITRLHVRYNRENFPQDLVFQATPRRENIQARYVINHPVKEKMDCELGKVYRAKLKERQMRELQEFTNLTGLTEQQFALMAPDADWSPSGVDGSGNPLHYAVTGGNGGEAGATSASPSTKSWVVAFLVLAVVGAGLYASRRKV